MLTESQKKLLENKIYRLIKESLFETGDDSQQEGGENIQAKRNSVQSWLDSGQVNHAALAYELYGVRDADEETKGTYRSLFSKKMRGEDANGEHYDFSDKEINRLYNMKDRFIDDID